MANEQLNANILGSDLKPVFADGTAIVMRVKSVKNSKGKVEKEGQIEIIFLDMIKQKPLGEFVMGKSTAMELIAAINQNLANLERELASKEMPKPPEIKPTGSDSSYR